MTGRVRKAIYAAFLLSFFATAPTVVFYTAGYRLNFDTLTIVKTGLLSVSSAPRGADVYVDGIPGGKTPVLVDDLLPGQHLVRLERAGSIPWEKRLVVQSQRTTFAQNIVLFADVASTVEVPGAIGAFDVADDGRVTYAVTQAGWVEIWTANGDGESRRLLSRVPESDAVTLTLSKDGSFVSVATKGAKASDLLLVNTESGDEVRVGDLVTAATDGWWDAARGDRFFVRATGRTTAGLYMISVPQASATKLNVPAESTPMSAMSDGNDYFILIPTGNSVAVTRWDGNEAEEIALVNALAALSFAPSPDNVLTLVNAPRTRLMLVNARGGDTPVLLDVAATALAWRNDRLLHTNGLDLRVFDTRLKTDELLTRVTEPIVDIGWHPGGEVVTYAQATSVTAIELDERDHHIITRLADGAGIRAAWIDPRARTLRFIGRVDNADGIFARPL